MVPSAPPSPRFANFASTSAGSSFAYGSPELHLGSHLGAFPAVPVPGARFSTAMQPQYQPFGAAMPPAQPSYGHVRHVSSSADLTLAGADAMSATPARTRFENTLPAVSCSPADSLNHQRLATPPHRERSLSPQQSASIRSDTESVNLAYATDAFTEA
jgi:hypothetical protein